MMPTTKNDLEDSSQLLCHDLPPSNFTSLPRMRPENRWFSPWQMEPRMAARIMANLLRALSLFIANFRSNAHPCSGPTGDSTLESAQPHFSRGSSVPMVAEYLATSCEKVGRPAAESARASSLSPSSVPALWW